MLIYIYEYVYIYIVDFLCLKTVFLKFNRDLQKETQISLFF